MYLCRSKKNAMLKERPLEDLKKEEFLKLSELARVLPDITRPVLAKLVIFDLLPWHIPQGRSSKNDRPEEVKRVLRALEPLRAKEIPLKYCRVELERLAWYKEMRSRESAGK